MIRIGFIGLDSSHCTAFTELLQSGRHGEWADVCVVAGFPGGNPEFPLSRDRVQGFTQQMRGLGVTIVDSIPALLHGVDAVILGSVDGRQHLSQAEQVFRSGKPVFIDKPLAHNLPDALRIRDLGRQAGVPWFSSSALRFQKELAALMQEHPPEDIVGCDVFGPSRDAVGHLDLAWYGIHGIELLFTLMGTACQSVTRLQTERTEFVSGVWTSGRVGTFRGIRNETHAAGYGATVFGTRKCTQCSLSATYDGLVTEIVRFFRTGKTPVPDDVTIRMFEFLEAADESKRRGGIPVRLESIS